MFQTLRTSDSITSTEYSITSYKDKKTPAGVSKIEPGSGSYEEKVFNLFTQYQKEK